MEERERVRGERETEMIQSLEKKCSGRILWRRREFISHHFPFSRLVYCCLYHIELVFVCDLISCVFTFIFPSSLYLSLCHKYFPLSISFHPFLSLSIYSSVSIYRICNHQTIFHHFSISNKINTSIIFFAIIWCFSFANKSLFFMEKKREKRREKLIWIAWSYIAIKKHRGKEKREEM